jgi:ribosomal protein L29
MESAALRAELENRRREVLETRCRIALGEDVRPHHMNDLRKTIARILTVLREKEGPEAVRGESA